MSSRTGTSCQNLIMLISTGARPTTFGQVSICTHNLLKQHSMQGRDGSTKGHNTGTGQQTSLACLADSMGTEEAAGRTVFSGWLSADVRRGLVEEAGCIFIVWRL